MFFRQIKACCFTIIACITASSYATTNGELDLDEASRLSNVIVIAEVANTETKKENHKVYTELTLSVLEGLKGNLPSKIILRMPGGSFNTGKIQVTEIVPGVTRSLNNGKSLYFLSESKDTDSYNIVGFTQGQLDIRVENGQDVVQGTLTDGQPMTINEIKARISATEEN